METHKIEGDLKLNSIESLFLYNILREKFLVIKNQQTSLVERKFELIEGIVNTHRKINQGNQSAFFGLGTLKPDSLIEITKKSYRTMIEVQDIIDKNEYNLECISLLISKIKDEFNFRFSSDDTEYIPIEKTGNYQHIRKCTLLLCGFKENDPDENYIQILRLYSTYRVR